MNGSGVTAMLAVTPLLFSAHPALQRGHVDHEAVVDVAGHRAVVGLVDLLIGITSTSAAMPCSAQKSSISCVSADPADGASRPALPPADQGECRDGGGLGGAPTWTMAPSRASRRR